VDAKVDAPGARGPEASVREERMVLMVLLMLVDGDSVACCELRMGTRGDSVREGPEDCISVTGGWGAYVGGTTGTGSGGGGGGGVQIAATWRVVDKKNEYTMKQLLT
jgi:hypothetical protein